MSQYWRRPTQNKLILGQVVMLTISSLKARYRKTVAGFLWVVLNPLIMYGVQFYVFSQILKLNVPNYYLFLLTGLLPWLFFVQTLEMCTSLFLTYGPLLKAFPTHPLVYLFAQMFDNFINFLAAFFLLMIPAVILHQINWWGLLLLPIALLSMVITTFSLAWLLATMQVFFRDTRYIVSFVLSVSFYLTPVFYSPEFVPERFRWMVTYNPFFHMIRPFRASLYEFSFDNFSREIGFAFIVGGVALAIAAEYWRHKKNEIYLNI